MYIGFIRLLVVICTAALTVGGLKSCVTTKNAEIKSPWPATTKYLMRQKHIMDSPKHYICHVGVAYLPDKSHYKRRLTFSIWTIVTFLCVIKESLSRSSLFKATFLSAYLNKYNWISALHLKTHQDGSKLPHFSRDKFKYNRAKYITITMQVTHT